MKTYLFCIVFLTLLSLESYSQTTYYSRQTGNWNTLATWSLTDHATTNAPLVLPTAADNIIISASHTVTIPQGYTGLAASVTVSTGNLFIGDGTVSSAATLNITGGSMTINAGGTVRLGASTNNAARTANLNSATITLNGTGALTMGNAATNANTVTTTGAITLNGSSVVTIGSNTDAINTLTAGGLVTIETSASLVSGGNGGPTSVITLQQGLINDGTINFATGTDAITLNVNTLGGTTTNAGTLTFGNNIGVKTFNRAVTNPGTWTSTAVTTTGNLIFQNGISSSGPFSAAGATFNTNSQAIGGNGAMSFAGVVTISGATTNVTNNNSNIVSITGTGAAQLTGTAGASWIQGANSTLNYAGSTITTITLTANTNSPNTVIYSGATPTIQAVAYNNLTYSGSTTGSMASGSISGNLTANTGAFNSSGTITFNGASDQTISGTGAISFTNVTSSTTSAANILVNRNISVSGTTSWTANGLFVIGSGSNMILGSAATIASPSSTRYIQVDGTTGTGSNLIKTTANNTTSWAFTFPVGTSVGGYTPVVIPTITTAPVNNSTLSLKPLITGNQSGVLKRNFRVIVAGNANATTFSNGQFFYNDATDISSGDVEAQYTTAWRFFTLWEDVASSVNTVANNFTVTGGTTTTASLSSGTYYFTLGNAVDSYRSWYSYQTGNFDDFNSWTLDPSGTTFDNGLSLIPGFKDEIQVINGFTITMNSSNRILVATTIQNGGTLDMASSLGNDLGIINGAGLLKVNGTALPNGTFTDFVSTSGGTIEYYNVSGNLPTTQTTYNKLKLTNSTGANIIYTQVGSLIVNGTFDLQTTGAGTVTWQINDASNVQRTATLFGDVTIASGGRITVGTGNEASATQHAIAMHGNFTNNGIVKFYDPLEEADELPVANYGISYPSPAMNIHTNELQGNAATVTFVGTTNKLVTCNNTTDFYRLVLNKGTGQQAMLTINSTSAAYFRLFGPSNLGSTGTVPNEYSADALSIINGTMQLTGSINIPLLTIATGNDYFPIPQNGQFWMNGASVNVTLTDSNPVGASAISRRLMLSGTFRITNGTFNSGVGAGIGSEDGCSYVQEGGTVNTWQFRPRAGGNGVLSFAISGGTLNIGYGYALGGGFTNDDYSRFDLSSTASLFQMSGGVMNVAKPTNINNGNGGIFKVGSNAGNYNVTGGTVNLYAGEETTGNSYTAFLNSTAPIYNLNIYEESATTQTTQLQGNSLTVLNNLTIYTGNTPSLIANNLNVTVGGNFAIQTGTIYTPGTGVTTFNGSGAQTWTYDGSMTLTNVVMNKPSGTLTLAGANAFPTITGGLTLTSGILADAGKTLSVSGTISNSATHSGAGSIVVSVATAIGGSNGTFGNLTITTNGVVTTSGAQTVTGNLQLNNATSTILNIGQNSLTALGNITTSNISGLGLNYHIRTNGFHNAGGLTRKGQSGDLLFPLGTGALYTPNTINVTAATHGNITVRPVSSQHPLVTTTVQGIRYYWRVTSVDYLGITAVAHKSYGYSTITEDNPTANYRSARYDPATYTWATNNSVFNATASPPIPNFSTGTGWTGVSGDQLDGEYTCGNIAAFGVVKVFYSRATGNWNESTTWSNASVGGVAVTPAGNTIAGTHFPGSNSPVIIGNGSGINHTITAGAIRTSGTLSLNTGSTLDCGAFVGHTFGTNTGSEVTGGGTLRIATPNFPSADFTNFIGPNGGTVEWYSTGSSYTIPSTGPGPQSINLSTYYNLILNPAATFTITLPANNLTVYNNWTQQTGTGTVTNNGARTISVNGNLTISAGTMSLTNSGATNITVAGNVSNAGIFTTTGGTHTLTTNGSLTNNGTLNFNNTGTVALTFAGGNDVGFTGTGSGGTTLRSITVNKGSSQTPTVLFNVGGTVTTPSTAWLTLSNGTFNFNNAGSYTLNNAASTYSIPSTAKLKVSMGTVDILTAASNTADLLLSGTLEVAGGTVNVGNSANNFNNDIEYASAGAPTVSVSAGSLYVNGSIRRSASTITGALVYNQTGGTVTVGGRSSDNARGVFEIDANLGSSFTLTGSSNLIIQRQTGGTGYSDVFINPLTSNVSSTSTISVGLTTATTQSNLRVNIAPSIGNFTVLGPGANANPQTVNLFSNPLVLGGSLTITTPSILLTNSLDVNIAGNMAIVGTGTGANAGTYTSGTNTTTFNGTGAQSANLTAVSTFNNLTIAKTGGSTITLSGASPSLNNLNILSGILDVGSLALSVSKDIVNTSSQVGSGSILINSTTPISNSITSNAGSFTNLTLGGSATSKTVNVSGNLTINGTLNFATTNRYLMIGSNRLTFGNSAGAVTGVGATAFVRTNGVSSDLGVVKDWPIGTNSFIYPIGVSFRYTPVSFSLNATAAGKLTIVPVNSAHLTRNQLSGERILNYYWIVTKGNNLVATATADHTYNYAASMLSGTGGTLTAGYLDVANPTGWVTSGHGGSATTTQMNFTNAFSSNVPSAGNSYNYSVGTANTLPNPIAPLYSRKGLAAVANLTIGGTWGTASNWTTDSDGDLDLNNPSVLVPSGVPVVILPDTRINIQNNGRNAFKTVLDGLLDIGTRTNHNLGVISGTGTLRVATNTFPAGDYTAFVAPSSGTIEYVAPMTMNNRNVYNNLTIYSGSTGVLTMTSSDLTINGNVNIPSGTTLSNSTNNSTMSIAGNWINGGAYVPGTGTVSFVGSTAQSASGTNAFNNLTINKTDNLTLTGTATVNGVLTLTSGNIMSNSYPAAPLLILNEFSSLTGGSATSFVSGQIRKVMGSGTTFTYPTGSNSASRYRPVVITSTSATDTWDVSYIPNNATSGGFSTTTFNVTNMAVVSTYEYWQVANISGTTTAGMTLSFGPGSYSGGNIGTLSTLKTARWNGSEWDLPPGGGTYSQSGSNVAGTVSVSFQNAFSPQTIAGDATNSPLPVTWRDFDGIRKPEGVYLSWSTATEINNDYFQIERSIDGVTFLTLGTIAGAGNTSEVKNYTYLDNQAPNDLLYYKIRQVDFDGQNSFSRLIAVAPNKYEGKLWTIMPNPVGRSEMVRLIENINTDSVNGLRWLEVTALDGKVVLKSNGAIQKLNEELNDLLSRSASTMLLVRISNGSNTEVFRLLKQ